MISAILKNMLNQLYFFVYIGAGLISDFYEACDTEFAYNIAHTLAYDEKYLSNALGFRTAGSDAEHAPADTAPGIYAMFEGDFETAASVYKQALAFKKGQLVGHMDAEIKAMQQITTVISGDL